MTNKTKLTMSSEWLWDEREQLIVAIQADLTALEAEEQEWRKTILWDAPCYKENRKKRDALEQLVQFATHMETGFLEANRSNFNDYLQ